MPFRWPSTATQGLQYCASVAPVHHRDHAGHRLRRAEVELRDARVGVRAAEERDVREPRQAQVVGVRAAPLQQPLRVRARTLLPM